MRNPDRASDPPDLTILPGRPEIAAQSTPSKPETWIEDYLDHLCAPLVGVVPWEERQLLRGEAAFHIERLVNDYRVEGLSEAEAVQKAIVRYGESGRASESFLDTWYRRQPRGWFLTRFGLANGYAMFYFGLMAALSNALVQMRAFFPSPDPLTFAGLNPAQIRRLIPEPLPIPEASPLFFVLLGVAFVAPFLAGWLTGSAVLVRPASAVWRIQTVLTLGTFLLGVQMLPMVEGLMLAVIELFWWLPIGALTAWAAAQYTWRQRCRYRLPALAQ